MVVRASSMLALFTLLSVSALTEVPPVEATTISDTSSLLPRYRTRFPPRIVSRPPPSSPICVILPLFCRRSPPPPPIFGLSPPPPPPPTTGVSLITTFISGTLACPINSELPRFTLLTNALVDLRCTGIFGSPTGTFSLATTTTNDAGNYFIALDASASSRFNPSTCVLAITPAQANVCFPATQISNVPLRVLTVNQGVVFVTSPLFA